MLTSGDNGDLGFGACLAVVLEHCCLVSSEFTLNLGSVVAGGAFKIALRIGKVVGVKAELGLCDFKIVARDDGLGVRFERRCGRTGLGCEAIHQSLILRNQLLKFGDLLRKIQGFPGKNSVLRSIARLP